MVIVHLIALLIMQHNPPNFVVVVHPDATSTDAILGALRATRTVALQSMTYAEWLSNDDNVDNNVLYFRDDGELLYVNNAPEIAHIREELAAFA